MSLEIFFIPFKTNNNMTPLWPRRTYAAGASPAAAKSGTSFLLVMVLPDFSISSQSSSFPSFFCFTFSASLICSHPE